MPLLTELDATFIRWTGDGISLAPGESAHGANGVMFTCPTVGHTHKVVLWFHNPLDCEAAPVNVTPIARWQRIGDTILTLSLAPSINIPGDWHGFVLAGVAN